MTRAADVVAGKPRSAFARACETLSRASGMLARASGPPRSALLGAAAFGIVSAAELPFSDRVGHLSAWLVAILLGGGIGGLVGLATAPIRSRRALSAVLVGGPAIVGARHVREATERIDVVLPWLGDVLVVLVALALGVLVVLVAWRRLARVTSLGPVRRRVYACGLGVFGLVLALDPLLRFDDDLVIASPWLGLAAVVAIAPFRFGPWLALALGAAAVLALGRLSEAYVELASLVAACASGLVLSGARSLLGEGGGRARPRAAARVTVACALAMGASHGLVRHVDDAWATSNTTRGATSAFIRLAQSATDFDGDGHGAVFRHADCAPFDARVGPGMHEVPGNALDENCSGRAQPGDGAAFARARETTAEPPRPYRGDVVLVLMDTVRYDDSLAPELVTLQRARASGVDFTRAYASASFTAYVLVGLLGGRMAPQVAWQRVSRLSAIPREPVGGLVPMLAEAGYDTGFAGGATDDESNYFTRGAFLDGIRIARPTSMRGSVAELETAALDAWRALDPERPRFLWIHAMNVHDPHPDRSAYRRSLLELDRSLGRLRRAIGGDAMWIFLADHGEEFHEHGGQYHARTLFEECVHVPLVVVRPDLPPRRVTSVTSTRALFATLEAMVRPEHAPPGRGPYLCLGGGACTDAEVPMALELPSAHLHGVVRGTEHVVRDIDRDRVVAFDLVRDPGEQHPRPPSRAGREALLGWEENVLGADARRVVWPYAPR